MPERADLVVIGAGPAGTAAAITAARRGRRVVLLERGRYPRHKVCGEFVSAESLQLLDTLLRGTQGVQLLTSAPRIPATRVFLQAGEFEAPIEPPAASIARFNLDLALWNAAIAAGVDARDSCWSDDVSQHDNEFLVTTGDKQIGCRQVIYAAGRRTDLAPAGRAPLVGLKAHFRTEEPLRSVDLYFGKGEYCGVQPLGGRIVNVCALLTANTVKRAGADRMRAAFEVHERLRPTKWEQVTETFATAALTFSTPEPVRNGMACAGDAAGFIDPFLGDGISLALQSGALAGSIENAEEYAVQYRQRFLPVFRRAARLRRLLNAPVSLQKPALFLMKWPGIAAAVVERTRAGARHACSIRGG